MYNAAMKKLSYQQLRKMWLDFLADKDHAIIPSAPIVPENDASTLFTTAGMQPLVPFLLGETHPAGKRIANIQRCVRTNDIEEVGDNTHLTFFEMMGNWSLGDYFKREKVAWSYEFLTGKEYLGIPSDKICVTCFEGDKAAPKDTECAEFWKEQGVPEKRIYFLPKSENWWAMASGLGPQGPCSEMFFDQTGKDCKKGCNPSCGCGRFVELGNDVYMQFVVDKVGEPARLAVQKNVDTGWGLERVLCFVNGGSNVYQTELFAPALEIIGGNSKEARILAEHTRAACMIICDGVLPSNSGAGYVLRRLIRRAVRMANKLSFTKYDELIKFFNSYLVFDCAAVTKVYLDEVAKFASTLETGLKEFEKVVSFLKGTELSGKTAFRLYETYGFPIEVTRELALERGLTVNMVEYEAAREKHVKESQAASASAGAFKGGLADSGEATARLHTATHLLLAALREMFGTGVVQRGSNITPERLRFDFSLDRKVEPDALAKIEAWVNQVIKKNLAVKVTEMTVDEAKKLGAVGVFGDRYGDRVKVYSVGGVSCEICGGPHAGATGELGKFKILKEESVAAGVRRIKAVLV